MTELEQLRSRSARWSLAEDSKLITAISSIVESILDRSRAFDSSLASTSSSISRLHSTLDTAESAIGLYSGSQFIEQRVLDDDYRPRRPSEPVPSISLEQRQSIILGDIRLAMKNGLNMIDTSFRKLGDENDPFIQYEPIDRYNGSIPPLIGSEAFHAMRRKKKQAPVPPKETISVTVVEQKTVEASVPDSSSLNATTSPTPFAAPPPPPPPMPSKPSPIPLDRAALNAQITSVLSGGSKGEFRVPHDEGPQDVDTGLTPPLPPRSSLHPDHSSAAPILPPRGSIQHATPPELPPKKEEKPSSSIPLPAEPKKKSIFDFDSDDDDFAAVLARPSKAQASSSTLSSSMRSNESDTKSNKSQEAVANQGVPSSLASELAAAAANKRAQQLAGSANPTPPPRSAAVTKKPEIPPESFSNPLATPTPAVKREEKKEEEAKPTATKPVWVPPKKSIFDDEDSDFDELFKPMPKKKEEPKKEEVKKEEPKKIEEKKAIVTEAPKPVAAPTKQPEKTKRKNLFDSDSDLEDLFKPKAPLAKKTTEPKREEEPQKAEQPTAEKSEEQSLSNRKEETRKDQKEEKKEQEKTEEKSPETPIEPPVQSPPKPADNLISEPLSAQSIASESKEEKEEAKEDPASEAKEPPFDPLTSAEVPVEEPKKEQIPPLLARKPFSPVRESPPPFGESPFFPSKSSTEKPAKEATPEEEKSTPAPVKKEHSVHFDSPPPFNNPVEEPEEERDERDSSATEDSDTETMQGNRAAFMAQLNAKLAAKPPTGLGVRPVSMIETSSSPFVPPAVDRSNAVPAPSRRAASEAKTETKSPLSHVNKSRPRGPARRPPTAKQFTSSSDSESSTSLPKPTVSPRASAQAPKPTVSPVALRPPVSPSAASKTLPPKSPVATSPVKESPVVFRKTSDPKSPPASVSRKSSSSSLGPDADPLSALSAVHTSPYKGPSAAIKPPINPVNRMTVSSISTVKDEPAPSSQSKTDSKPVKSIFDSDSDDFYEKFGGSKTLPTKNSAFRNELESALKKDQKASTSKKGIFDDSDEDLEMFRKKK